MKADLFLKESLSKTLALLSEKNEKVMISDLYVKFLRKDGQIVFLDDEQQQILLFDLQLEWVSEFSKQEQYIANWNRVLSDPNVVSEFEKLDVLRPFSLILLDEDGDHIEELFCMDDDNIAIDSPFLKEIDDELDKFLKSIMEE